jgi:outer membrane protein
MRIKTLAAAIAAVTSLAPIAAQAQAESENPWMIRIRAVDVLYQNGQTGVASDLNLKAKNQWIPEFDVSYFFTKNIAAELVLTYPQQVNLDMTSGNAGKITALPPSLLLQYHFTDLGAFKPYVGAGVNYTIFGNRTNFPGLAGTAVSVDQSSFGFAGQIGMDYMLDKNWGLNVDVKYITMATNVNVNGANAGKLTLNPWTPGVGVTYKF